MHMLLIAAMLVIICVVYTCILAVYMHLILSLIYTQSDFYFVYYYCNVTTVLELHFSWFLSSRAYVKVCFEVWKIWLPFFSCQSLILCTIVPNDISQKQPTASYKWTSKSLATKCASARRVKTTVNTICATIQVLYEHCTHCPWINYDLICGYIAGVYFCIPSHQIEWWSRLCWPYDNSQLTLICYNLLLYWNYTDTGIPIGYQPSSNTFCKFFFMYVHTMAVTVSWHLHVTQEYSSCLHTWVSFNEGSYIYQLCHVK